MFIVILEVVMIGTFFASHASYRFGPAFEHDKQGTD
jgi:hypothetical protein